ncbi:MAG: hypothetical protein HZA15_15940 [Nitrospirae bacterium]|nr:hypothetical protein [Nitrospirota bacterium]
MSSKKAFLYIDDDASTVKSFRDTVRREWNMNYDVLSNVTFGPIAEGNYDTFEKELFSVITDNYERIECVFLDIDFGSSSEKPDKTGLLLGRALRKHWPSLPIIIATRFAETDIYKKGMIFDFDNLCDPMDLIGMDVDQFTGMLALTKEKRSNFLASIGDIPVSYRLGKHQYFRHIEIDKVEKPFVFVAMPFDLKVVRDDVWKLGIHDGCKNAMISPARVDEDLRSLAVMDKIASLIFDSALVIADMTGWNANVLYELGIAHAANKPCILITQKKSDLLVPFDVRHIKFIIYSDRDLSKLRDDVTNAINQWRG